MPSNGDNPPDYEDECEPECDGPDEDRIYDEYVDWCLETGHDYRDPDSTFLYRQRGHQ